MYSASLKKISRSDSIIRRSTFVIRHSSKFHTSGGLDSAELVAGRLKDSRSDRKRNCAISRQFQL